MNHALTIEDSGIGFTSGPLAHGPAGPRAEQRATRGVASEPAIGNPLDLLSARFRVIRRMVGEASFRGVALRYIASEPPRHATPGSYGETFPAFIRQQGNSGSFDYIADIAALELAVGKARDTARVPEDGVRTARLVNRLAGGRKVTLHPSASLVQSRFPIVTIWESLQGGQSRMIDRWRPEAALVVRRSRKVEIVRLPPGGCAFLHRLAQGQTIAAAAAAAEEAVEGFDLAANLTLLQGADIVVDVQAVA